MVAEGEMVRLLAPPPLLLAAREARATEVVDLSRPAVPVARCCASVYSWWSRLQLLFTPPGPLPDLSLSCLRAELSEQGS